MKTKESTLRRSTCYRKSFQTGNIELKDGQVVSVCEGRLARIAWATREEAADCEIERTSCFAAIIYDPLASQVFGRHRQRCSPNVVRQ
jgi:hypothetical protein